MGYQIVGLLEIFTLALSTQPTESEVGRTWIKVYEGSLSFIKYY